MRIISTLLIFLFSSSVFSISASAQEMSALDIMKKVEQKMRGNSNFSEIKMTIVRPDWSREMTMKSWAKGEDYALIQITAPARDKGTMFLKRQNELFRKLYVAIKCYTPSRPYHVPTSFVNKKLYFFGHFLRFKYM